QHLRDGRLERHPPRPARPIFRILTAQGWLLPRRRRRVRVEAMAVVHLLLRALGRRTHGGGERPEDEVPGQRAPARGGVPAAPAALPAEASPVGRARHRQGDRMARFSGVDFYEIDSLLSEEERQIRDHVRGWVEDRYLPLVERAYEEAYFPAEVIPEIAEMGLLGATLPEKYGCA